ncbi:MAG: peptidylprolyl isomerase, partial [Eubacterium sp.]|nr:peptidylprolyl isomerase [Eubacterium sp.]
MEDGGEMKLELYPDIAPNTVRNFVNLVQKGFYNGLIFHRVTSG